MTENKGTRFPAWWGVARYGARCRVSVRPSVWLLASVESLNLGGAYWSMFASSSPRLKHEGRGRRL